MESNRKALSLSEVGSNVEGSCSETDIAFLPVVRGIEEEREDADDEDNSRDWIRNKCREKEQNVRNHCMVGLN